MLDMSLTTIPRPLSERLGPEASDALVDVINRAVDDNKKDVIQAVEDRFVMRITEALAELRKEMAKDKIEIFERMAKDRVWNRVALSIIIILLVFNVPTVVEPLLRAFGVAR